MLRLAHRRLCDTVALIGYVREMRQDDGGLGEARASYAAKQEEARRHQEAIESELEAQIERVNLAAAAFVQTLKDEHVALDPGKDGYAIMSGSVWRDEGMAPWVWTVVVTRRGEARMFFDGKPVEVLSFRRHFSFEQPEEVPAIRKAAQWLISEMARTLEEHRP
jgi:hypothetical protein